jgi:hypothetical protein
MSDSQIIVTPANVGNSTIITAPQSISVTVSQVGTQGPSGASNISTDANNGLTTGTDSGLYVTNAVDLGTFN